MTPDTSECYHVQTNRKTRFNTALITTTYLLGISSKLINSNNITMSIINLPKNIAPIVLPLFFSQLNSVSASGMIRAPKQVVIVKDKNNNKKTFFVNSKGYMEYLWLYQPESNIWNNISPDELIDLDHNGCVNCYAKIETHTIGIKGQNKILFIGYSEDNIINLLCYHIDNALWEKLPSPPYQQNGDLWSITNRYDVVQSDIVNIDGQEKLLVTTRSYKGINLNCYDPRSKTWTNLPAGPKWGNKDGWGHAMRYSTIQTQIIKTKDNKDQLFLIAKSSAGIELHSYDFNTGWAILRDGPRWDAGYWENHMYYSTIQTQIIKTLTLDGNQKLFLLARNPDRIYLHYYDIDEQVWVQVADPAPTHAGTHHYGNAQGFSDPMYYSTIQTCVIKTIDGKEKLFLFNRHSTGTELQYYDPNNPKTEWIRLPPGPPWSNANGWTNPQYYFNIKSQNINIGEGIEQFLVHSHSAVGVELYYCDIAKGVWVKLPNIPIAGQKWYKPTYYQHKNTSYNLLCESIKNANIDKIQELLKQDVDLFYGLELEIMLDNYKLYLINTINENDLSNLCYISGNAILLLNDNKVYFIKNGKIEREPTYYPKSIIITDRKGFTTANNVEPLLILTGNYKDFIKMVLSQIDIDKNLINRATRIPIEYYEQSPLGLALSLKHEATEKIIRNLFLFPKLFSNAKQHISVYLYLAAKQGDERGLELARQFWDLGIYLDMKINLDFLINKNVIDQNIVGEKDFFEIAIENNREGKNQPFIEWFLEEKFIATKIFQPQVKHLQLAIRCLQADTVKLLLKKQVFSSSDLKIVMEQKFFYINQEISYLEYAKYFSRELYLVICTFIKELASPAYCAELQQSIEQVESMLDKLNVNTEEKKKQSNKFTPHHDVQTKDTKFTEQEECNYNPTEDKDKTFKCKMNNPV